MFIICPWCYQNNYQSFRKQTFFLTKTHPRAPLNRVYNFQTPLIEGQSRVGVIKIVIVINCNLITFLKIIENNCNSALTLITIIEM